MMTFFRISIGNSGETYSCLARSLLPDEYDGDLKVMRHDCEKLVPNPFRLFLFMGGVFIQICVFDCHCCLAGNGLQKQEMIEHEILFPLMG